MKNIFTHFRIALNLLIMPSIVCTTCYAEIVTGRAEYLYGPDTTQNEACNLAIKKAISTALSQELGEYVSAQETLSCKGSTGKNLDYACELNQLSWSQIDGHINKTIAQDVTVSTKDGAMVCTANVKLDVAIPTIKPDPNFQLKATVNSTIFRVRQKDEIQLDVELSQPGYLAVFNWLPYINNLVNLIDPVPQNSRSSTLIKDEKIIKLSTAWSDSYSSKRKFYDEYLIVVATKKQMHWLSKYSYEEFSKILHQIPESEKRMHKIVVHLVDE
jgi:hypothetical protein